MTIVIRNYPAIANNILLQGLAAFVNDEKNYLVLTVQEHIEKKMGVKSIRREIIN